MDTLTCKQPDRDCPGLQCGHPLPCPHHTIIVENGKINLPEQLPKPEVLGRVFRIAKIIKDKTKPQQN